MADNLSKFDQKLLVEIKTVEGYLRDDEAILLFQLAKNIKLEGVIVEIGSWMGKSTICLAKGSKLAKNHKVFAIDPHSGSEEHTRTFGEISTFKKFQQNIKKAKVSDLVKPLVMTSDEAVSQVKQNISLLFIDGAHDYQSVLNDFNNWFSKLLKGGVVALHDTVSWPGPQRVVREKLFASNKIKNIGIVGSICFGEKTEDLTLLDLLNKYYIKFIWELRCFLEKIKLPKPLHSLAKKIYEKLR